MTGWTRPSESLHDEGTLDELIAWLGYRCTVVLTPPTMPKRVRDFLATALAWRPLLPAETLVLVPFQPVPGKEHALWLDFAITGGGDLLDFDILLAVEIGERTLLDRASTVRCQIQGDGDIWVVGLPEENFSIWDESSQVGTYRVRTVARAFSFSAPAAAMNAAVRARVMPRAGAVIEHMNLLVTPTTWPGRR